MYVYVTGQIKFNLVQNVIYCLFTVNSTVCKTWNASSPTVRRTSGLYRRRLGRWPIKSRRTWFVLLFAYPWHKTKYGNLFCQGTKRKAIESETLEKCLALKWQVVNGLVHITKPHFGTYLSAKKVRQRCEFVVGLRRSNSSKVVRKIVVPLC